MAGTQVTSRVTAIVSVLDKATGPLRGITAQFQRMHAGARSALSGVASGALRAAGALGRVGAAVLGLGALGGAASLAGLVATLNSLVGTAERLGTTAERLGTTVERVQDLEQWAKLADVPVDALTGSLEKLNRNLALAAAGKNKEAAKLLGFLGLSARDARGHVRSAVDILPTLADRLAKIKNPAVFARVAMALMGKSAQTIIPALRQGSRGLAEATAQMTKLGRLSTQTARDARELGDAQDNLNTVLRSFGYAIASRLIPYQKQIVTGLTDWITKNRAWLNLKVDAAITAIARAARDLWRRLREVKWEEWGRKLGDVIRALGRLADSLGGIEPLLLAVVAALGLMVFGPVIGGALSLAAAIAGPLTKALLGLALANPTITLISLAILGLITAGTLLYKHWDTVAAAWGKLWRALDHTLRYYGKLINKNLGELGDRIAGALGDAFTASLDSLTDFGGKLRDKLVSAFTYAWDSLRDSPLLRMLSFLGAGPAAFGGGGGLALATVPAGPPRSLAGANPAFKGPPYALPPGGQVDLNVRFDNAPPGTRVDSKTAGRGLRTKAKVGHSMPGLQGEGAH